MPLARAAIYAAGVDDWMSRGNTVIVGPGGTVIAGPLREEEGIPYAEIDPATIAREHRQFDAAGHYSRPDVLGLEVDRTQLS